VWAIDRDDVHAHQHLVEAFPVGGVQFLLDARRDAAAVVIVDLQSERLGAARHRLSDAPHADDAQALAPDAVAEHPGRAPAVPVAIVDQHAGALGQAPGNREDQRHGHVRGVFGENAGRVGDGNAALHGGGDVDVVHAVAEIGDQPQALARLAEHRAVDVIGHGRHQNVGDLGGFDQLRLAHRLVVGIEPRVEQFAHAHLDAVRQAARDDDQRLLALCHSMPLAADL
jgi:hypothetical protein